MLASNRISALLSATTTASALLVFAMPSAALSQSEPDNWAGADYALAEGEQTVGLPPVVSAVPMSDPSEMVFDTGPDPADLPDACDGLIGDDTIVRSGTNASTMKVQGRVHADAWWFPQNDPDIDTLEGGPDGPQARLGFRRVRLGANGTLPANMEYEIEMEFAEGNLSEFRDVWLGWVELPVLRRLHIGNQKRPYGLDHLNSSRYNVFMERPFVIESFNQDARRWGIQSYGVSEDERWNWRYGVFNLRLIQDEGEYLGDDLQMEFAGRLANTIWYDEVSGGRGYAHWAISSSYASPAGNVSSDNDPTGPDANEARFAHHPEARTATRWLDTGRIAGTNDYYLMGLEGVTNLGPLQLVGEWQQIWLNRDASAGSNLNLWGAYCYVSYFLTGEHMPWNRSSGTLARPMPFEEFFLVKRCRGGIGGGRGAWQIAARYSYANFNDEDISGGMGESLTIGLNWYWTSNARMQFNWLHGRITENGVTRAPDVLSGDYDIIGMRFMVDF